MQENTIEIDSELYERLAIWSMECGQDDVNEFINKLLLSAAKQDHISLSCRSGNNILNVYISGNYLQT
jgi:predicted CopG family antitoxin